MAEKSDARWKDWKTVCGMFSHYAEDRALALVEHHKVPVKLAFPNGQFDHRGRELAATKLYDMDAVRALQKVDSINRWRRDEEALQEIRKSRLQSAILEAIHGA